MDCRYALQFASKRYAHKNKVPFQGTKVSFSPQKVTSYKSSLKPSLKPTVCKRADQVPTELKGMLQQGMCMSTLLALMQLHPVVDDATPLEEFAKDRDPKSSSFTRVMYVVGRMRHQGCLQHFKESNNDLLSLDELERCKKELNSDIRKIETTDELSTVPE